MIEKSLNDSEIGAMQLNENIQLVNEVNKAINKSPKANFKKKKIVSKAEMQNEAEETLTEKNQGSAFRMKKNNSSSTTKLKKGSSVKMKKKKLEKARSKKKLTKKGSINKISSQGQI